MKTVNNTGRETLFTFDGIFPGSSTEGRDRQSVRIYKTEKESGPFLPGIIEHRQIIPKGGKTIH